MNNKEAQLTAKEEILIGVAEALVKEQPTTVGAELHKAASDYLIKHFRAN